VAQRHLLAVFAGRVAPLGPKGVASAFIKNRVVDRVSVTKRGLIGDEQADLAVHGGADKAVYAYPAVHYPSWLEEFPEHAALWGPGSLGENLSVSGCDESNIAIGDVFRLGSAILQVTQPRKPCFKLALRFGGDQRIAPRMIRQSRTGWYCRVLEDGCFGPGDAFEQLERPHSEWSVKRVNETAYDVTATTETLQAVAALPALSAAWRAQTNSAAASISKWRAVADFRRFVLVEARDESASIRSLSFAPADGGDIPPHQPGQHVQIKLRSGGSDFIRRYTISSVPVSKSLRVSVKREASGLASRLLHQLQIGQQIEISKPQGRFVFDRKAGRPVVLLSAGVGITPMISMLHAAVTQDGSHPFVPQVLFCHVVRNGAEHAFREQFAASLAKHPNTISRIFYSRPSEEDRQLRRFDQEGRLRIEDIGPFVTAEHDFYLCGPASFMATIRSELVKQGVPESHIKAETFDFGAGGAQRFDFSPDALRRFKSKATVRFGERGKRLAWTPEDGTLLELAEKHEVTVSSDCRMGLCGTCAARIVLGEVTHLGLDGSGPADGEALLCRAIPRTDELLLEL
jgi:ferredoxin-NADP reductase/MOSC domain-containing protein YiiM